MTATESRVAQLRERTGRDDAALRDAVENDQRARLLAKDLNVGGCLSLAAEIPDTLYVLEPAFVQGQLVAITGPNGHGKSTLAVALLFARALDRSLGPLQPTRKGLGYLVSAEDIAGTRLRFFAEATRHNLSAEERAHVDGRLRWCHVNSMQNPAAITDAILKDASGEDIAMVVVDTGPALFAGDNENDNTQLQAYAAAWRRCTELPGAPCVPLLWHPSKGATADNLIPRGGSALIGTLDANLTVWREADAFTLGYTKLRSPHFEPIRFSLDPVSLVLPSGAHVTVPVATAVSEDNVEARDRTTRERREAVLLALSSTSDGERPSLRDLAQLVLGNPAKSSTVRDHLRRLAQTKPPLVEQDALSERYGLTPAGKRAVAAVRAKASAAYRATADPE